MEAMNRGLEIEAVNSDSSDANTEDESYLGSPVKTPQEKKRAEPVQ
jgi:hypothetical protein